MKEFLRMENIHKRFPGVHALKGVNISVAKGEVHALLGENGAGKSTLMKVLGGVHKQDEGKIYVDGKEIAYIDPQKATELGIAFVHQELNLSESLSVAENMYMGRLPYKNKVMGIVDYKKLYKNANDILNELGVNIKATDIVSQLPTAKKQMIEIAKAISQNAKIIIFDEPTTSLANNDVETLFKVINKLKANDVSIIYISHRLKEIFELCDRATVMRDGSYIGSCDVQSVKQKDLIKMMVGRELNDLYPKVTVTPGEIVLECKNICSCDNKIKDASFNLRKGEVIGLSGLVGSGRTELARLIFGADKIASGNIFIQGKEVSISSPIDAIKNKICLITEDRKKQGLCLPLSVEDNITITMLNKSILDKKKMKEVSNKYKDLLKIKTSNLETIAGTLSGGNQQKIVIAKWLNTDSEIFIFDEPTKGIDVGAKSEIYSLINDLAQNGKSVIMISSEMPELLAMSDRIYVMCEGRITGELDKSNCTQEKIMELSTIGGELNGKENKLKAVIS